MNLCDYFDSVMSLKEGAVPICTGCLKLKVMDGDTLLSCSACLKVKYCSRECQKRHWKIHKKVCVNAKSPLRFSVGDRVRCCPKGQEEWTPWKEGTIIGLYMFKGKYPYSISCDDGKLLHAPKDDDLCIQKIHGQCVAVFGPDGMPLNPIPDPPAKDPAAELRQENLFKESPPEDDCPLCNIRFPMKNGTITLACCSKSMCIGCEAQHRDNCPFCDEDLELFTSSFERVLGRLLHRMDHSCDDQEKIQAMCMLATHCDIGEGVTQNSAMAHELWMKAVELGGSKDAHYNLSMSYSTYYEERGVEKDDKKQLYHLEEAAMLGDAAARCQLGNYEAERGHWDQAKKHWMLSAAAGCESCMEKIKRGKKKGVVSNVEYKKTLRLHRKSLNLTQSAERDAAREQIQAKMKLGPGGVANVFD